MWSLSTSSAFLTSTISTPNVDSIIDAVATILHSQMLEVSLRSLRIKMSVKQSPKAPFSITSQKRSTLKRNQMPSTKTDSSSSDKCPVSKISTNSSKRSMTALNSGNPSSQQPWVRHYKLGLHKSPHRVHRSASESDELASYYSMFFARCAEGMGRQVSLELRFCIYLSFFRAWWNQHVGA